MVDHYDLLRLNTSVCYVAWLTDSNLPLQLMISWMVSVVYELRHLFLYSSKIEKTYFRESKPKFKKKWFGSVQKCEVLLTSDETILKTYG